MVQAGEVGMRPRQPWSSSKPKWIGRISRGAPRTLPSLLIVLALLVFLMRTDAFAASPRLLTARFTGGCIGYTIAVTGEGLRESNSIVSYNITLTPPTGEPIAIVDSFPVTPEKDGRFHGTIQGTWKNFEFTLAGKYTLSGSAILASNLTLLHTLPVTFSRKNMNCRPARSS